ARGQSPLFLGEFTGVVDRRVILVSNSYRVRRLLSEPLRVVDLEMHPIHLPSESVHGASKLYPVLVNRLIENIVSPDNCSVVERFREALVLTLLLPLGHRNLVIIPQSLKRDIEVLALGPCPL